MLREINNTQPYADKLVKFIVMKKILLPILMILITCQLFGQNKKNDTLVLKLDYNQWNNFSLKDLTKPLKVGQLVKIECNNVPEGFQLKGSLDYENRNLENGDLFTNKIDQIGKKTNDTSNAPPPVPADANNSLPSPPKIGAQAGTSVSTDSNSSISTLVDKISTSVVPAPENSRLKKEENELFKKFKLNETNMDTVLEIGVVQNYFKKLYPKIKGTNDTLAFKNALIDLKSQARVIRILKENINRRISVRDSVINSLSFDEPKTEYLIFRVQNYDNTQLDLSVLNDKNKGKHTTLPFKNKGGVKIDFSTGLVFNRLIDDNFELVHFKNNDSIAAIDSVRIADLPSPKVNISPAVMAHTYLRNSHNLNVAFTMGLCYNVINSDLNYLLGGSFLFGSEQRCVLTFGAMVGKRKQLKNSFNEPSYYGVLKDKGIGLTDFNNRYGTTLLYNEIIDIKCAVGVSYNLNLSNKFSKGLNLN